MKTLYVINNRSFAAFILWAFCSVTSGQNSPKYFFAKIQSVAVREDGLIWRRDPDKMVALNDSVILILNSGALLSYNYQTGRLVKNYYKEIVRQLNDAFLITKYVQPLFPSRIYIFPGEELHGQDVWKDVPMVSSIHGFDVYWRNNKPILYINYNPTTVDTDGDGIRIMWHPFILVCDAELRKPPQIKVVKLLMDSTNNRVSYSPDFSVFTMEDTMIWSAKYKKNENDDSLMVGYKITDSCLLHVSSKKIPYSPFFNFEYRYYPYIYKEKQQIFVSNERSIYDLKTAKKINFPGLLKSDSSEKIGAFKRIDIKNDIYLFEIRKCTDDNCITTFKIWDHTNNIIINEIIFLDVANCARAVAFTEKGFITISYSKEHETYYFNTFEIKKE